jgi:hypothetical protein
MRPLPSLAAAGFAAAATLAGPVAAPAGAGTTIPVPTFTLSGSTGLVDGSTVQASWTNQFVGLTENEFGVWECLPGPLALGTCDLKGEAPATPNGSVQIVIARQVGFTTCGTDTTQCSVRLISNAGVEKGSVPIEFSSK